MTGLAPWAASGLDPDRVIAELRRRFPGARAWWGPFTGTWWAIARDRTGRHHLIEAPDPAELGRRLEGLGYSVVPRFPRTVLRTGAAAPPPRVPRATAPTRSSRARRETPPRASMLTRLARRCRPAFLA